MKLRKAFTLIELLAVIIILAIVALIATPIILDVVDDARKSAGLSESNMIYSSINNYCASIEMKKQMGTLDSEDVDCSSKTSFTTEEISKMVNLGNTEIIEIEYSNKLDWLKVKSNGRIYSLKDNTMVEIDLYRDNSGANYPELLDNMIPVKYENDNWIYADVSQEWYDYDAKKWANAVVLNDDVTKNVGDTISEDEIALWYVWIPRYTYTIFNGNNGSVNEQEIQIKFESGISSSGTVKCIDNVSGSGDSSETCTDSTNNGIVNGTSTYTHPSFTFGNKELTGFWVGKFEVSGNLDKITIKPNESSLRNQNISSFFTAIQNISTTYNLNGDSHMIKNMEWGAVVYLSHSRYGTNKEVGINNNSSYITGCGASTESNNCNAYSTTTGMLASTTQNIYGVYDMSGGAWEYVMGNMVNSSEEFYSSNSGFIEAPDSKYYDNYTYGTSNLTHGRGKLGDATKETLKIFGNSSGGWYNDYANLPYSNISWFYRGGGCTDGTNAGMFYFTYVTGGNSPVGSTRAILVK